MENQDNQQQQPQIVYVTQAPPKRSNGKATAGFVLALVATVLCWIHGVNCILWILGLIFSIIGVCRAPRGFAIAGLIISAVNLLLIAFSMTAMASCL